MISRIELMRPKYSTGFSLVELLIVVAIIAILAAIGYPLFVDQVREGRRTEATTTLAETSHQLERCYTRFRAYNDGNCDVPATVSSEEGWYDISVQATPQSFDLTATPQGDQTEDPCGEFTLDERGIRGVENLTVDQCW